MSFNRMMGMMAGAASMLAMSAFKAFDYSKPPPHPRFAKRHKKAKGNGYGRSKQKYDPARLIIDRPSTIRKLQRWHRAGVIGLPEPDHRAKMRHAWYRNQMAKEGQTL